MGWQNWRAFLATHCISHLWLQNMGFQLLHNEGIVFSRSNINQWTSHYRQTKTPLFLSAGSAIPQNFWETEVSGKLAADKFTAGNAGQHTGREPAETVVTFLALTSGFTGIDCICPRKRGTLGVTRAVWADGRVSVLPVRVVIRIFIYSRVETYSLYRSRNSGSLNIKLFSARITMIILWRRVVTLNHSQNDIIM